MLLTTVPQFQTITPRIGAGLRQHRLAQRYDNAEILFQLRSFQEGDFLKHIRSIYVLVAERDLNDGFRPPLTIEKEVAVVAVDDDDPDDDSDRAWQEELQSNRKNDDEPPVVLVSHAVEAKGWNPVMTVLGRIPHLSNAKEALIYCQSLLSVLETGRRDWQ